MPGRDLSAELFGSVPAPQTGGRDLSADLYGSDAKQADPPPAYASVGAGVTKSITSALLTLQQYAGKALPYVTPSMIGQQLASKVAGGKDAQPTIADRAGQWVTDNAAAMRKKLDAAVAPFEQAHPTLTGLGDIAGGAIATLPVGGLVGGGVSALADIPQLARIAPQLSKLGTAIETTGLKTGAPLAADASLASRAGDLAIRSAGAGVNGAASAAIASPDHIERGALLSAAVPPALVGAANLARYGGGIAKAVTQPFTKTGQNDIAANIIQKFGDGGPMAIDTSQLVPGSLPTLAEATGNAGIATLQRAVRDMRPNAFADREASNAAARLDAFDNIAGDPAAIEAAKAARSNAADSLYGQAFAADAMRRDLSQSAQQMRSPFSGVGLSAAPEDLATPGLRDLAQRPQFQTAVQAAKQLAANNGMRLDDPLQSLQGLHYVKLALDDALNPAATTAMGRNATASIMSMRDGLTDELSKIAPLYGNARQTFAEMSQPINAMEALQGLRMDECARQHDTGKGEECRRWSWIGYRRRLA